MLFETSENKDLSLSESAEAEEKRSTADFNKQLDHENEPQDDVLRINSVFSNDQPNARTLSCIQQH